VRLIEAVVNYSSVHDGGVYAIRESRSAAQKGTRIEDETNILQDGTLIDLCGATLLWRSVDGFRASPTKKSLEEKIDILNASRPQCPVGLNTLVIPRKPILPANHYTRSGHKDNHHHHQSRDHDKSGHQPYVYLKCGHVQGYHDWGTTEKSNQRTCPICLSVGNVAKLSMGLEPSFYVDSGPLTHVFSPCGHMSSENTIKYWCSIEIPHGTHFFHSICPFCAVPLATNEPASTKLIFQDEID
jgi:pellino